MVGEGDACASHIPPGISFEVEREGLSPTLQPNATTQVALLGVIEFAANDCLIESECHVGTDQAAIRARIQSPISPPQARSAGCFTNSSFPNF
jgi:hypothetical protein